MNDEYEVIQKPHLRLQPVRDQPTSALGTGRIHRVGSSGNQLTFCNNHPIYNERGDIMVTDRNLHLLTNNIMGEQATNRSAKAPAYAPGLVPEGKAGGTRFLTEAGLWGEPSEHTGVTTSAFTSLEDTPDTFVDQWGKFVRVSTEGELEFVDMSDVNFPELHVGSVLNVSDERAKQDIHDVDMGEATDILRGITPVKFRYKEDPSKEHIGVLAQELQRLFPTSVVEGDKYLKVSYLELVGLLVATSKSLVQRVDALESKLEALRELVLLKSI